MPKIRDLGINTIPLKAPGGSFERVLDNCSCTNEHRSIAHPQCPDSCPKQSPPPCPNSQGQYTEHADSLAPDVILQLKHHLQDRMGTGMYL